MCQSVYMYININFTVVCTDKQRSFCLWTYTFCRVHVYCMQIKKTADCMECKNIWKLAFSLDFYKFHISAEIIFNRKYDSRNDKKSSTSVHGMFSNFEDKFCSEM